MLNIKFLKQKHISSYSSRFKFTATTDSEKFEFNAGDYRFWAYQEDGDIYVLRVSGYRTKYYTTQQIESGWCGDGRFPDSQYELEGHLGSYQKAVKKIKKITALL